MGCLRWHRLQREDGTQFTLLITLLLPCLTIFIDLFARMVLSCPHVPGSAQAWEMQMQGNIPASLTDHCPPFPLPQRLRQLVTPDPSLPQPKQHLHLDGGSGQGSSPSPVKEGLTCGEKETHL